MGDDTGVVTTMWHSNDGWSRLVEQRHYERQDGTDALREEVTHTLLERHIDWYGREYWCQATMPLAAAQLINFLMDIKVKA